MNAYNIANSNMEFLKENINIYEKNFLEAVGLTMVSMVSLSILPHLQYKYKAKNDI